MPPGGKASSCASPQRPSRLHSIPRAQTIVAEKSPKTAHVPLLGSYIMYSLLLALLNFGATCVLLRIFSMSPGARPPPQRFARLVSATSRVPLFGGARNRRRREHIAPGDGDAGARAVADEAETATAEENGHSKRNSIGEDETSNVESRQTLWAEVLPVPLSNACTSLELRAANAPEHEFRHVIRNGSRQVHKRDRLFVGLASPTGRGQRSSCANSGTPRETPPGSWGHQGDSYASCYNGESVTLATSDSNSKEARETCSSVPLRTLVESGGGGRVEKIVGWNHLGKNLTRLWNILFLCANVLLFVYYMAPLLKAGILNADKGYYYTFVDK